MDNTAFTAGLAVAEIDLEAIRHNLRVVRQRLPTKKILAMVKSQAYGHGLIPVARALDEADALGVACLSEALSLRKAGIDKEIVLISGFHHECELEAVFSHELTVVIHDTGQVDALCRHQPQNFPPIKAWLKLETGMNRLGLSVEAFHRAYTRLQNVSWIQKPLGMMTHLAMADEMDAPMTLEQLFLFHQVTLNYAGEKSIANSAGILYESKALEQMDWLRPGIMLYGVSPDDHHVGSEYGLRPAMKLTAPLLALREVPKGARVGYGGTWRADRDSVIGTLFLGYGDGLPRRAAGALCAVRGRLAPLVGRVSMDLSTLDLTDVPGAQVGDRVVLWGTEQVPVEAFARSVGGFQYELLTAVGERVQRRYGMGSTGCLT